MISPKKKNPQQQKSASFVQHVHNNENMVTAKLKQQWMAFGEGLPPLNLIFGRGTEEDGGEHPIQLYFATIAEWDGQGLIWPYHGANKQQVEKSQERLSGPKDLQRRSRLEWQRSSETRTAFCHVAVWSRHINGYFMTQTMSQWRSTTQALGGGNTTGATKKNRFKTRKAHLYRNWLGGKGVSLTASDLNKDFATVRIVY